MLSFIRSLSRDERGISALEYAILAGVLLTVIAAGIASLSGGINTLFGAAATALTLKP